MISISLQTYIDGELVADNGKSLLSFKIAVLSIISKQIIKTLMISNYQLKIRLFLLSKQLMAHSLQNDLIISP